MIGLSVTNATVELVAIKFEPNDVSVAVNTSWLLAILNWVVFAGFILLIKYWVPSTTVPVVVAANIIGFSGVNPVVLAVVSQLPPPVFAVAVTVMLTTVAEIVKLLMSTMLFM